MRIIITMAAGACLAAAMAWPSAGHAGQFDTCAGTIRAIDRPTVTRLPEAFEHFRGLISMLDTRDAGPNILRLLSPADMHDLMYAILGNCRNAPDQTTQEAVDAVYGSLVGLHTAFTTGRR
jgi:hypothetical protein